MTGLATDFQSRMFWFAIFFDKDANFIKNGKSYLMVVEKQCPPMHSVWVEQKFTAE